MIKLCKEGGTVMNTLDISAVTFMKQKPEEKETNKGDKSHLPISA